MENMAVKPINYSMIDMYIYNIYVRSIYISAIVRVTFI